MPKPPIYSIREEREQRDRKGSPEHHFPPYRKLHTANIRVCDLDRKEEKEKCDDKMRVENREGSLGYPGFVSSPFDQAVDVGCGTGQSTLALAPYFQSVLGCDVSKSQILEANFSRKPTNVQYRVSPAECLPVGNESVCLLTAGTCFHCFDIPAYFR
ncbi:methyltransferase DDB_G0268948 [Trichonephila clavipes]|nr:methyltransferase DDB_G0268948 [Trichonephila clavipes]